MDKNGIQNIDESWDGHSFKEVEEFIKEELSNKYDKICEGQDEKNRIVIVGENNTLSTTPIKINQIRTTSQQSDWDEPNPNDPKFIKNKPFLNTDNSESITPNPLESITGVINLHKVSKTGSYEDLSNKPNIPEEPKNGILTIKRNDVELGHFTANQDKSTTINIDVPTTTGELINDTGFITEDQIPEQVNADWNSTDGVSEILNKPTKLSEFDNDSGFVTEAQIPEQVNADWNSESGLSEILNKPTNLSDFNNDTNYSTIHYVDSVSETKQDLLEPGQNIKNINGVPITGSGNIYIPKGDDGLDAVNPFKGWFESSASLPNSGTTGDYAYVSYTTQGEPQEEGATIWIWNDTINDWENTNREVDTNKVQTFATGEEVNQISLSTNMKNGNGDSLFTTEGSTKMYSTIGDVEFDEIKSNYSEEVGYYVSAQTGSKIGNENSVLCEISIPIGYNNIRFFGYEGPYNLTSGFAFGYYEQSEEDEIWHTVLSSKWEYNESRIAIDKIVSIPENATHFRTTCLKEDLGDFYCYLQKGTSLYGRAKSFAGTEKIISFIDATKNNWVSSSAWDAIVSRIFTSSGNFTYYQSNIKNPVSGRLNLSEYISSGFNRILIKANANRPTYYTFTTKAPSFPSGVNTLYVSKGEIAPSMSTLNNGYYRLEIPSGETKIIEIPSDTDAKYLYLFKQANEGDVSCLPELIHLYIVDKHEGVIDTLNVLEKKSELIPGVENVYESVECVNDNSYWQSVKGVFVDNNGWLWDYNNSAQYLKSYYIDLSGFIDDGFNNIKIYSRDKNAMFTFTKELMPENNVTHQDLKTTYLSEINGGELYNEVAEYSELSIDIEDVSDTKYVYFTSLFSDSSGEHAPFSVEIRKISRSDYDYSQNTDFASGEKIGKVSISVNLRDGGADDVTRGDASTYLHSALGNGGFEETKTDFTPIYGYVSNKTGKIVSSETLEYCEIDITGFDKVRFLGLTITSDMSVNNGFAFGYYETVDNEEVWTTTFPYSWKIGGEAVKTEYIMEIPEGSTHLRTMCGFEPYFGDGDFYCYVQNEVGSLFDMSHDNSNKIDGSIESLYKIKINQATSFSGDYADLKTGFIDDSGDWNTSWTHRRISLEKIKTSGLNQITITANVNYSCLYTFMKRIPSGNQSNASGKVLPYLSELNGGNYYMTLNTNETTQITIPEDSDAKWLVLLVKSGEESSSVSHLPSEVFAEKVEETLGLSNEVSTNRENISIIEGYSYNEESIDIPFLDGDDYIVTGVVLKSSGVYKWSYSSSYKSYKIPLRSYIENGFNKIKIFANEKKSAYYTFTNKEFPESSVEFPQIIAYLSQLSAGEETYTTEIPVKSYTEINLTGVTDAEYLYLKSVSILEGKPYGDMAPYKVIIEKTRRYEGEIERKIKANTCFDTALKPFPPALKNIRYVGGIMEETETYLTTSRIYGDFFCELNEPYEINRIMLVDISGNVVNDYIYRPYSNSARNRSTFGLYWSQNTYGYVLEIIKKKDDKFVEISTKDKVFKKFMWVDTQKMKGELLTSPMYNSNVTSDEKNNLKFSPDSISSALKRAKICAMIPWEPTRYIMPTNPTWRGNRYLPNTVQLGAPYSSSSPIEKWFGMCVSPYTFLSALRNPYSILYTEKIGSQWNTSEQPYPFETEYGMKDYNGNRSYGSTHGIIPYGFVCSAYGSYVCGFDGAVTTDGFAVDARFVHLGVYGTKTNQIHRPINVSEVFPMTIVTTPGHTYIVIDFLLDSSGERIAAIVSEETNPATRTSLYTIEALEERFIAEYNSAINNSKDIEISIIKPSILDSNKNKNLWDVSDLYPTREDDDFGSCEQNVVFDENIMFWMGDKSVIMEYVEDGEGNPYYLRNFKSWLIVKPEDLYSKIKIEKQNRNDGTWDSVCEYVIDEVKEEFSDNNQEYFKVDATQDCKDPGKYRACLTNNDMSEESGYTQWIVLKGDIYVDENDENKIKWMTYNEGIDENSDEFAEAVYAIPSLWSGQGYYAVDNGYQYIDRGYITQNQLIGNTGSKMVEVKVNFKCSWGTAIRSIGRSKVLVTQA